MERDEHIYCMIKTSSVFCNLSTKASQLPLCVSDEKRCFVAGVFQNARSQALPKLVLPWQAAKWWMASEATQTRSNTRSIVPPGSAPLPQVCSLTRFAFFPGVPSKQLFFQQSLPFWINEIMRVFLKKTHTIKSCVSCSEYVSWPLCLMRHNRVVFPSVMDLHRVARFAVQGQ